MAFKIFEVDIENPLVDEECALWIAIEDGLEISLTRQSDCYNLREVDGVKKNNLGKKDVDLLSEIGVDLIIIKK